MRIFYLRFGNIICFYVICGMRDKSIHASSSEQASRMNKDGHKRELERKEYLLSVKGIASEVIIGNGKGDLIREDKKIETIKGGVKCQWFLFGPENVKKSNIFTNPEVTTFYKFATCWDKINPHAEEMCRVIKQDPKKWVRFFIGADKVDIISIKDHRTNEWLDYDIEYFINKLMSRVTEIYYTGTKVVFKGGCAEIWPNNPRRKNGVVIMELDRRSSKKRSLFHSVLDRVIDCVK